MLVHPVVIPGSGTRSWTVLGDDDVPVAPVDRFLAYLTDIGRSPNTVKAYAHDMKDLWQFLGFRNAQLKTSLRGPGKVLRPRARTWSGRRSTATCSPTTPCRP